MAVTRARAIAFGTKAETLDRIGPLLTRSYVLPLVSFPVSAWRADPLPVLGRVRDVLGPVRLVVRSSARSEDNEHTSNAGAHDSVLGVDGGDDEAIARAVETVIASYTAADPADQVLVQPQLTAVRLAGVLFTRDLTTLGPYRVFNYDDRTRSTESVTSGTGTDLKTYVRFRRATHPYPDASLEAVHAAVEEIEGMLGDRLEIELAVDDQGRVCVFQVRPLVTPVADGPAEEVVADYLVKVAKKVEKLSRPHPHLQGTRSVFGVMPDWNPAEIIGVKPRTLALTLYKEIVTDSIWAYMRDNYGYRNLRSFPLLVSFLGVPFIDVRVSFNSFVPKGVRDPLARKLVDHYVDRLVAAPHAHDKVEFDIVFSCYYPGIARDAARLEEAGFSGLEIGELLSELRVLTNRIIHPTRGLWREDLAKIDQLEVRHRQVASSAMSSVDKFYWFLEDCKRYGTLPFSGLARAGFIAMQFLRGLVGCGVLEEREVQAFLGSLDTITNRMGADVARLARGEIDRGAFLASYGHLRPGTYDILSPRYDEDFGRYFGDLADGGAPAHERRPFSLPPERARQIDALLASEGLEVGAADLFSFCRAGIEGREYAKLVFTRNLSDALVELEKLGRQCGLGRDDLSHLDVRTVQRLYSALDAQDLRDVLLRDIEANRASHAMTQAVRLPDLILGPDDVFHFFLGRSEPNFVTLGFATADVVREEDLERVPLAGKVVFVRSADPGYDWIFSKGVAALVTQFGGANSHMAIRSAEQGIPAIIGCGERNFAEWGAARTLEIDCANRTVRILR